MKFKPTNQAQICLCGTLIRSKPGRELHLVHCPQAQAAKQNGQDPFKPFMPTLLELYKADDPAFRAFLAELETALMLADRAFQNQSISSARAARVSFMKLQKSTSKKKQVPGLISKLRVSLLGVIEKVREANKCNQ